jgi:uncharacterized membrane protein YadS
MDPAAITTLAVTLAATTHHQKHSIGPGAILLAIVLGIVFLYIRYRRDQIAKNRNRQR